MCIQIPVGFLPNSTWTGTTWWASQWILGPAAAYTAAGMESEPGPFPLDSLMITFATSAWLGSSVRESLIGTWGRQAIASSLMADGCLRKLWKVFFPAFKNLFLVRFISVFPSALRRLSWIGWIIGSLHCTVSSSCPCNKHKTESCQPSYSAMSPAFDEVPSVQFLQCCWMQPFWRWIQDH